jgi:hypothetical protein
MLLEYGASVNCSPSFGLISPLSAAFEMRDTATIKQLLELGATPVDEFALLYAMIWDHEMHVNSYTLFLMELICRRQFTAHVFFGWSVFGLAVELHRVEVVDKLLEYGFSPGDLYHCGKIFKYPGALFKRESALGRAIRTTSPHGLLMVQKFLRLGLSPNVIVHRDVQRKIDLTALLAAIQAHAAEAKACNKIIAQQKLDIIHLLLDHGADLNLEPSGNILATPLQAACLNGNLDMVKDFLSRGAQINAPPASSGGSTALQYALMGGFFRLARLLLDHGADFKAQGSRVLELAIRNGHIEMLQLLVDAGAQLSLRQYNAAKRLATEYGHNAARKLLESLAKSIVLVEEEK